MLAMQPQKQVFFRNMTKKGSEAPSGNACPTKSSVPAVATMNHITQQTTEPRTNMQPRSDVRIELNSVLSPPKPIKKRRPTQSLMWYVAVWKSANHSPPVKRNMPRQRFVLLFILWPPAEGEPEKFFGCWKDHLACTRKVTCREHASPCTLSYAGDLLTHVLFTRHHYLKLRFSRFGNKAWCKTPQKLLPVPGAHSRQRTIPRPYTQK